MSYLKGLAMAVVMAFASPVQAATTVNVDLMFVVDRSGSMRQEFQTLGARIGEVLNGLAGATNPTNGVSIGSVQAGLVSYLGTPQLEQSVTGNVMALQNAFNGVTEGVTEIENGPHALFQFIGSDDPGLVSHGTLHDLVQYGRISCAQRVDVRFQVVDER